MVQVESCNIRTYKPRRPQKSCTYCPVYRAIPRESPGFVLSCLLSNSGNKSLLWLRTAQAFLALTRPCRCGQACSVEFYDYSQKSARAPGEALSHGF